ncbi:MAG: helix-turn-helix domain-containing protein [Eubacteriales bacterium]|mgnify:FL=1|nr:helix-turn-helix domain-containing protein [Eubacteriales bacterium]
MNIGEKIAKARKDKGLTQADLGDKMHVTFQAVSKWERGESAPDFETICALSEILDVPITYFGGKQEDVKPKEEVAATRPTPANVAPAEYKPVLAVCEKCNKPIYDGSKIVRYHKGRTQHVKCADCKRREIEAAKAAATENGKKRRIHSFIWPSLLTIAGVIACACTLTGTPLISGIIGSVMLFPLSACLILYNNVVGEVVIAVISWSAVKFPGIIFSFDIDGVAFLVAMKVLFFILGIMLTIACIALSIVIGGVVSVFVYPFAIHKNFVSPEKGEYSVFD